MQSLLILAVVGLIAQLVDGSLGMAYGVTSSTLLISAGIAPAAASAAVHFSEIGTTVASGIAHHKLGNVDWRTVRIIALPGGIGAFAGATLLSNIDGDAAKPWVAALLLGLGLYVMWRFLVLGGKRPTFKGAVSGLFLAPLGLVAGLMDAIGGGGWGPVGTTTLLSTGRLEPRKVVGSIDASEFIVAIGGSVGFLLALGSQGIDFGIALALLAGGVIAAPFAAWLVRHMAPRVLGVAAGGLIVITNLRTILLTLGVKDAPLLAILGGLLAGWLVLVAWTVRKERATRRAERAEVALAEVAAA
ncbi:MAG TPA: sulfite exporter TauE/SafE family protein [Candidatus Limnocylindrales bacterium]|nr:sulfite exporter TauE/SafE family protein [Candidatus Limnocylindrales bacterium]